MNREERYRRLFEYGCIACKLFCGEWVYRCPQMHHIVSQSYRKHQGGDRATLPLCPWHHMGHLDDGLEEYEMTAKFGPSLALQSKEFHTVFGDELVLLDIVDRAIGV